MKKLITSLALAAAAVAGAPAANAAIVLTVTPAVQQIAVGGTATATVSISGLGSEILSAFDLNFLWNSSILSSSGVDFTPACSALGAGAICVQDTNDPGNIGFQYSSLLDDATLAGQQLDSFDLGTLTFIGQADGSTTLTLGADADFERNFVGLRSQSLNVEVVGACIAVGTGACSVPEPATSALLVLALLGAAAPGALRQRRETPTQA